MLTCLNCYGNATVEVLLLDQPDVEDGESANETYVITIEITSINDPPSVHLFSLGGLPILQPDPTEPVMVGSVYWL